MITTIITTSHYCRQADKEQYRWRLISILSRRGYVTVQIICVWYVVVVTTVFAMLHWCNVLRKGICSFFVGVEVIILSEVLSSLHVTKLCVQNGLV